MSSALPPEQADCTFMFTGGQSVTALANHETHVGLSVGRSLIILHTIPAAEGLRARFETAQRQHLRHLRPVVEQLPPQRGRLRSSSRFVSDLYEREKMSCHVERGTQSQRPYLRMPMTPDTDFVFFDHASFFSVRDGVERAAKLAREHLVETSAAWVAREVRMGRGTQQLVDSFAIGSGI